MGDEWHWEMDFLRCGRKNTAVSCCCGSTGSLSHSCFCSLVVLLFVCTCYRYSYTHIHPWWVLVVASMYYYYPHL
jgi:hypothetical protein